MGNPADPTLLKEGILLRGGHRGGEHQWWCDFIHFRGGFYGDYVFHQYLKNATPQKEQLDHTKINTNAALFILSFCNCCDLFATIGNTQLNLEGNISSFSPFIEFNLPTNGARLSIETSSDFSWTVGLRATLLEKYGFLLGVEGQYFLSTPPVKKIKYEDIASSYITDTANGLGLIYREWQLGLGISYPLRCLIPYAGIKWSQVSIGWENRLPSHLLLIEDAAIITIHNLNSAKRFGYVIGATIASCKKASLNVEGRFRDQKALYISSQVRF